MGCLLRDKVAIVTGSGKGLGRAIALSLAREGGKVVTNNRQPGTPGGDCETVAQEIKRMGCEAIPCYADVSDFEEAQKLIQTAINNFGTVHILVNNAGISGGKVMPWEIREEEWDRMIQIHLKGTFNCTRHCCDLMKKQQWGRIINCTSGSWISRSGGCHYAAAKAGIVGFTRAIAMDMREYGVTCNAYHPYAKTDILGPHVAYLVEQRLRQGKIDKEEYEWQLNPPGPGAAGPLVAYLASEEASYINGKVYFILVGGN